MGFRDVRIRLLLCLEEGRVAHWPRKDAYRKNWLLSGRLSMGHLRRLILRCQGDAHRVSPHDFDQVTDVHALLPWDGRQRWYLKFYFDDQANLVMFMSAHPVED